MLATPRKGKAVGGKDDLVCLGKQIVNIGTPEWQLQRSRLIPSHDSTGTLHLLPHKTATRSTSAENCTVRCHMNEANCFCPFVDTKNSPPFTPSEISPCRSVPQSPSICQKTTDDTNPANRTRKKMDPRKKKGSIINHTASSSLSSPSSSPSSSSTMAS